MPTPAPSHRHEDLITRLSSPDGDSKLKALRELKNQIIGNRTKKLSYAKMGAIPAVVSILAAATTLPVSDADDAANRSSLIIQSAVTIGSFACGVEAGARAVIDSGAVSLLLGVLSHSDEKIVDAGARSLKMIYQSKLATKYDFHQRENLDFVVSLLNSENENVTELGACIITYSCNTTADQKVLCDAGILRKLQQLLGRSINQRDASLEALATMMQKCPEVIPGFVGTDHGKALKSIAELVRDKHPRTRLLACICLAAVWKVSPCYLQDIALRTRVICTLLELVDELSQVGDDAPFALAELVSQENAQKLAFENSAVEKLCSCLQNDWVHSRRLEGIFLALAELCSKLEVCRSMFITLQGLKYIIQALSHDSTGVRAAACFCLRSVSRSVKSLSAGRFMNETTVYPLVELLNDSSYDVQIAALAAIGNIVVDFASHKSIIVQCDGVKQLIQLSKAMDSNIRLKAVWALRNLIFLADYKTKERIYFELTASTISSLVSDPEPSIQEQALGFICNLVDGCAKSIQFLFIEDGIILSCIVKQLQNASKAEVCIQGMYVLSNVASGNDIEKEAVMNLVIPPDSSEQSVLIKFLQSSNSGLRTAAIWFVVNLTRPCSSAAYGRVVRLRNAGIYSQVNNMVYDPCLDVKLRVRTALGELLAFGDVVA